MSFKIDNVIKIPPLIQRNGGHNSKYPWRDLRVGQSFFVPDTELPGGGLDSVRRSGTAVGHTIGAKFVFRWVKGGVRAWRIK